MNSIRRWLLALLFLTLPTQIIAAPARKPASAAPSAPGQDWTKVTARAASGAFLQGNPNAPVKLVEYLSLTCSHCAEFEHEGIGPLAAKYIRTGQVSYEVRHALRDGFDFAGSLLARCNGPQDFFTTLPKVFAQQGEWSARADAWSRIEQAEGLPPEQLLPKLARGAGFDRVFGMSPEKMDACIANAQEQKLLTDMASEAWHRPGFPGTPTFLINNVMRPEIRTWPDLDAALAAALHPRSPSRKTRR